MNKDHPTVTKEQLDKMADIVDDYRNEYDVTDDDWIQAVDEHFATLSDKNNGSILSFILMVRYLMIK